MARVESLFKKETVAIAIGLATLAFIFLSCGSLTLFTLTGTRNPYISARENSAVLNLDNEVLVAQTSLGLDYFILSGSAFSYSSRNQGIDLSLTVSVDRSGVHFWTK